jgi:hypothetical protein
MSDRVGQNIYAHIRDLVSQSLPNKADVSKNKSAAQMDANWCGCPMVNGAKQEAFKVPSHFTPG